MFTLLLTSFIVFSAGLLFSFKIVNFISKKDMDKQKLFARSIFTFLFLSPFLFGVLFLIIYDYTNPSPAKYVPVSGIVHSITKEVDSNSTYYTVSYESNNTCETIILKNPKVSYFSGTEIGKVRFYKCIKPKETLFQEDENKSFVLKKQLESCIIPSYGGLLYLEKKFKGK